MNREDYLHYWRPAALKLFPEVDPHASSPQEKGYTQDHFLDKTLGVTIYAEYVDRAFADDFPLDDNMKKLLVALTGPYGKVLLKVHRIRKGLPPYEQG
jgi:hypothetical protein